MTFVGAEERWLDKVGRLRDVVRQRLVAAQLRDVLGGRDDLRILDVGCGQGTQALTLARAGHRLTGLDPASRLLKEFAAALAREPVDIRERVRLVVGTGEQAADLALGPFDAVLCHGVLMYLDDGEVARLVAAVTEVTAPAGVLSLLVRNGLAPAMRPGLLGDWDTAMSAFESRSYVNRLGVRARTHTPAALESALRPLGWQPQAWFGVRVFTDHLDGEAPTGKELDRLLDAEREAGRRDPYRQVSALLHLIYVRNDHQYSRVEYAVARHGQVARWSALDWVWVSYLVAQVQGAGVLGASSVRTRSSSMCSGGRPSNSRRPWRSRIGRN